MNAVSTDNQVALDAAMAEYDELPALPGGYDRRVTFARYRILPLTGGEWPADLLAFLEQCEAEPEDTSDTDLPEPIEQTAPPEPPPPVIADDEPLYVRPKYQAPKLKTLEDIVKMCERNKRHATAATAAAGEGAGAR